MSERPNWRADIPQSSFCYISPLDGSTVPMERYHDMAMVQNELARAGQMIAELREEVDRLKAFLVID